MAVVARTNGNPEGAAVSTDAMATTHAALLGLFTALITSAGFVSCATAPAPRDPEPVARITHPDVLVYRVHKELTLGEDDTSVTDGVELEVVRDAGDEVLTDFWLESVAMLNLLTPDEHAELVFPTVPERLWDEPLHQTCTLPGTGRTGGLSDGATEFRCVPAGSDLPDRAREFERVLHPPRCEAGVCSMTWIHRGEFLAYGSPMQYAVRGEGEYERATGLFVSARLVTTTESAMEDRREEVELTYDAALSEQRHQAREDEQARRAAARRSYDQWRLEHPGAEEARESVRQTQESLDWMLEHAGRACHFDSPGLFFHAGVHPDEVWDEAFHLPAGPGRRYVFRTAWDGHVGRVPDSVVQRLAALSGQSDDAARMVALTFDPRLREAQQRLRTHPDELVREWAMESLERLDGGPPRFPLPERNTLVRRAATAEGEALRPLVERLLELTEQEDGLARRSMLASVSRVLFTRIRSVEEGRMFLSTHPSMDRVAWATAALDDPHFEVEAVRYLTEGPERPGLRAPLLARLDHRQHYVRSMAARALLAWGEPRGALALADQLESGRLEPAAVLSVLPAAGSTLGLLDYDHRDEAIGRFREWAEREASR